jgi:hypothetical protein
MELWKVGKTNTNYRSPITNGRMEWWKVGKTNTNYRILITDHRLQMKEWNGGMLEKPTPITEY